MASEVAVPEIAASEAVEDALSCADAREVSLPADQVRFSPNNDVSVEGSRRDHLPLEMVALVD